MSFTPDSDANFQIVKNVLFSQPGSSPVRLCCGQGNYNAGEKSHGLDTAQVHDFLTHFVEYICAQATAGGVVLTGSVVQNAVNAAKYQTLTGQRNYTFNPVTDANWAVVLKSLAALKGHESVPWLMRWIEDICQQATQTGVTLTTAVIQSTCSLASGALVGKRSF